MKNNKKKLNLKKCTISNLQLKTIQGGYHGSCVPDCNVTQSEMGCLPTQEKEILEN